uniref:Polycomb protein VEFS-Box domain-containing protein n=1 Tax=Panagrolaimus sp. PS1159 TaxID=55785 RepID=A0AC35FIR6_9BILA
MDKMKRQERPVRSSSYQGSYIELPFNNTDDDAYDGRIYLGPYTSTAKTTQRNNSLIAREVAAANNSQKAEKKNDEECAAVRVSLVRQTNFPQSCASIIDLVEDEEKLSSYFEDIPDLIKAEPMEEEEMGGNAQSRSSTHSEEVIPNLDKIDNENNNIKREQETMEVDQDRIMMPPPPLPWVKLKPTKLEECKFTPIPKPAVKDWNEQLISMYGSVENAHKKPWMSSEETTALDTIGPNTKMMERFSIQNWEFAPESIKDSHETSPLFKFPEEDGLDREISRKLQSVRDIINLYRTMRLFNDTDKLKRPVFLPFLRRNLRYNNYIPTEEKSSKTLTMKKENKENAKVEAEEEASQSSPQDSTITAKSEEKLNRTERSTHNVHDLSIKLLSIKHKMLPAGHKASVTFFYAIYKYSTKCFSSINKVDSSTFTVDVEENLIPVNIDLPPDLEFNENDPYEIFIILRVLFFDASKDVYGGKSLRNVPARLAGQCERAREEEKSSRKGSRKVREPREGDSVMYGAIQVTKKFNEKWSFIVGQTSLILVEAQKLDIDFDDKKWQRDKDVVKKMIALGSKYHTNPFVYIEINTTEEDDSAVHSNGRPKKQLKIFKKKTTTTEKAGETKSENDVPVVHSKYDLPPAIVYQLSLDFMYKDKNDEECKQHRVIAGFNTIVSEDHENIDTMNVKPSRPKGRPPLSKKQQQVRANSIEPKTIASSPAFSSTSTSSTSLTRPPEIAAAIASMDEKAPPPRLFTYCSSRSPGYCIFCEISHKNLFSLMYHYRTCHSRFNYVYRSAIEYKKGHYLPGFVLTVAGIDEDIFWHQKKEGFHVYKKQWPRKFKMDNAFVTPCNTLFNGITDGLHDIPPLMSMKSQYNRYGSRPIHYEHTKYGRLIKPMPDWMAVKMKRDLNDIVDLDPHEVTFMMEWNKFLYLYGPITGKETNVYKLCRSFVETRRKEIIDLHLEIPTVTLIVYFVQNKILSSDELYDIIMRLRTNYDPFTDILHPLSINERRRAKRHIQKQEALAERLRRKRPKKHYEPTTLSLRRRLADGGDEARSRTGSLEPFNEVSSPASSSSTIADSPSPDHDDLMYFENES